MTIIQRAPGTNNSRTGNKGRPKKIYYTRPEPADPYNLNDELKQTYD